MSEERREPVMSNLRLDKEEMMARNSAPQGRQVPISSRPVVKSSPLVPIAFLFAIAGLGLAGFVYWQFTQLQKTLVVSNARIAELESKLELTDDESSASLTAVQAKLKWADSEIRKLWGVSYDTNRKTISANKQSINANKKTVATLNNQIKSIRSDLASYKESAALEIKLMSELVDSQAVSVNKMKASVDDASATVSGLHQQLKEQSARLKTTEQAIDSIDAFRRSANADLLKLKSALATP